MEVKLRDSEYEDQFFAIWDQPDKGKGGGGIVFWAPGGFRDVQFPILMAYISVVHPYDLLII